MRPLILSLLALCLGACAAAPTRPSRDERMATVHVLQRAIDAGRVIGAADASFTPALEEASLAWLLYRGPAPMAGARRLLDLREHRPELAAAFLGAPEAESLTAVTGKEEFRSGQFFNNYDPALFRPFFRQALLRALTRTPTAEDGWLDLMEPLELAVRLTPRFAGVYPNQLDPDLRRELKAYVASKPHGTAADRFEMLLLWDRRNAAWDGERRDIDARLKGLAETTQDELLRLEIKDALASPRARPERAFWMSLAVPGLGQIAHGDVQGGILLGGLTLSAWIWMGSKLAQAQTLDPAGRDVALGDAAWAGSLALLGHAFTAMNAAEQARFINIVVEWDLLSKNRLQPDDAP